MSQTLTTGGMIARSLLAHGVDTIFGIPGAHMYDFKLLTPKMVWFLLTFLFRRSAGRSAK